MMEPSGAQRDNRHALIAQRAYQLWNQRGCPWGTPERDWSEAVREVGEEAMESSADNPSTLPFSDIRMGPDEM